MVATKARDGWHIFLDQKSFGHKLILDVVSEVPEVPEERIAMHLNNLYLEHGHFT